jgi:glycosyltransferase involved in cell wall biosynthesis
LNILLLCTDAFGGYGGIALFNRELTRALAQLPDRGEIVVLPRIIRDAVDLVPEGVTFVEAAARGQFTYARELQRVKRRTRFDLVICGHINLLPLARLVAKDPLLIAHGIEAWRPRRRASNAVLQQCRGIVAVSELTRSRLVSWSKFSGPTFVLPNAVRAEQYGIRPKRADLVSRYNLEGKRVVLTVGRIDWSERYKGFDEILEILPQLPHDVVYLIAGGGSDMQRLQRKALALGVGDRVRFTGIFAEEEKADLYNLADVYAMPSRGEGFGFVILEAMASGVPVIVSKHDGGREAILNGKLGTLVDPSNPAEIRAAITDALDLEGRAIPDGLDYFAVERFIERVHAIVRAVALSAPRQASG